MTSPSTGPAVETASSGSDLGRILDLPALTFLPDGNEVTVGRPDRDLYVMLPADGAALLQQLADGSTIGQAAGWYAKTYGETVDIDDFVSALDDLGFLGSATESNSDLSQLRFRRLGRIVFGPLAWGVYAVLVVATAVFLILRPELRPSYRQLFFSPSILLIELTILLGQVPGIALHESFHALAGRRAGVRSHLHVGRRLYYVVMETSMDGLVAVPRSRRYLPILAGMIADVLWFSVLTLLAAASLGRSGAAGELARICLCLAFSTLLRFLWQFQFYLRTDIYVLIQTIAGLNDLHGATWFALRRTAGRARAVLIRRPEQAADSSAWSDRELWHARWYGPLVLVGYGISIFTAIFALVPALAKVVGLLVGRIVSPHDAGTGDVLDAVGFLLLNLGQVALLVWLSLRNRAASAGPAHVSPPA